MYETFSFFLEKPQLTLALGSNPSQGVGGPAAAAPPSSRGGLALSLGGGVAQQAGQTTTTSQLQKTPFAIQGCVFL